MHKLNAKMKQLDVQEQELRALRDRDRMVSTTPTRGISVAVAEPVYGYWRTENELKLRFWFHIRNEWINPAILDRLTSRLHLEARSSYQLPTCDDKVMIGPFSEARVGTVFLWSLTSSEQGQYFQNPGCITLLHPQIGPRAYIKQGGLEFEVVLPQQSVAVIVYPLGTPEPAFGI